jgi:hypothetical protein
MTFDYDAATKSLEKELFDLVEELYPIAKELHSQKYSGSVDNKRNTIHTLAWFNNDDLGDVYKAGKFRMLEELVVENGRPGRPWRAIREWQKISARLPENDKEFYANVMIAQAQIPEDKGGMHAGYAWIVEQESNGVFREFISDDLLKESVNKGFWQIASKYLVETSLSFPAEDYERLIKHPMLDLTRIKEFKHMMKGRPISSSRTDNLYVEAFEKVHKKLNKEDAGFFARPIIEHIIRNPIRNNRDWDKPFSKVFAEQFEPYKDLLDTQDVQDLIREMFEDNAKYSVTSGSEGYSYLQTAQTLRPYLKVPDKELREIVSKNFPRGETWLAQNIVNVRFPLDWLDPSTRKYIEDQVKEYAHSPLMQHEKQWHNKNPVMGRLEFLQRAIATGWYDEKEGREKIASGLKEYLHRERRPAGNAVDVLLGTLHPSLVEQSLYREVIHKGISDLVYRNKIREASEWYLKAEKEGWLDKSKVPEFKVQLPKPPEEKRKRRRPGPIKRSTGRRRRKPREFDFKEGQKTLADF